MKSNSILFPLAIAMVLVSIARAETSSAPVKAPAAESPTAAPNVEMPDAGLSKDQLRARIIELEQENYVDQNLLDNYRDRALRAEELLKRLTFQIKAEGLFPKPASTGRTP